MIPRGRHPKPWLSENKSVAGKPTSAKLGWEQEKRENYSKKWEKETGECDGEELGFGVSAKLCGAVKLGFGDVDWVGFRVLDGHGPYNNVLAAKIVIVGTHFVTVKAAPLDT
jgi:hypothetical protein